MRAHCVQWGLGCLAICFGLSGCGQGDVETADVDASEHTATESPAAGEIAAASAVDLYPQVALETTHGRILLELDAAQAPETVRNFLSYVDSGHYNGTLFHQIDQGYVVVGGSFTADMTEKPARRPIRNEAENGLKNAQGSIAMSRMPDNIDSSTCQFFINLADNPSLDHASLSAEGFGYCVFGRVIDGWDVIETMATIPVKVTESFPSQPTETVMIRSAKRLR